MPRPTLAFLAVLFAFSFSAVRAQPTAAKEMAIAANAWLDSLTPELRKKAVFELADPEHENWHYIPKERAGVSLANLNDAQRKLARQLLATGLSERGLLQAEAVIALERVLRAIENSSHRDELLYFFTVFGSPADGHAWGWRMEGHHLSVNFMIGPRGQIVATPNFVGANPAEVRVTGPQTGKRALAAEEDLGRALVLSLSETQRRQAVLSAEAPGEILTGAEHQVKPLEPAGLGFTAMNPTQQAQLKVLVEVYANRLRPELAESELKKIADTGWNRLNFAWAGGFKPGEGHYYRIQSPDFVIEYDNTQNQANHIHTTWRVFAGDFGRDLLREHYATAHKGAR